MNIQSYIYLNDSCSPAAPLYVGVVDSSVVQVVAESCNHQSQDLQIAEVILSGDGWVDEEVEGHLEERLKVKNT